MKHLLKGLFIAVGVAAMLQGCDKSERPTPAFDFRDSLVGSHRIVLDSTFLDGANRIRRISSSGTESVFATNDSSVVDTSGTITFAKRDNYLEVQYTTWNGIRMNFLGFNFRYDTRPSRKRNIIMDLQNVSAFRTITDTAGTRNDSTYQIIAKGADTDFGALKNDTTLGASIAGGYIQMTNQGPRVHLRLDGFERITRRRRSNNRLDTLISRPLFFNLTTRKPL